MGQRKRKLRNPDKKWSHEASNILKAVIKEVSNHTDCRIDEEIKEFASHIEQATFRLDDIEFLGMFG